MSAPTPDRCTQIADATGARCIRWADHPGDHLLPEQVAVMPTDHHAPRAVTDGEVLELDTEKLRALLTEGDGVLGGRPWAFVALVTQAMQQAWDDWCDDTGCFPDAFEITRGRGRRPTLSAHFKRANYPIHVAAWLAGSLRAALVADQAPRAVTDTEVLRAANAYHNLPQENGAPFDTLTPTFRVGLRRVLEADRAARPAAASQPASNGATAIFLDYTNHRGERRVRPVVIGGLQFGSTPWHPAPQWLLSAWDIEKGAERSFALASIHGFGPASPDDADTPSAATDAGTRTKQDWRYSYLTASPNTRSAAETLATNGRVARARVESCLGGLGSRGSAGAWLENESLLAMRRVVEDLRTLRAELAAARAEVGRLREDAARRRLGDVYVPVRTPSGHDALVTLDASIRRPLRDALFAYRRWGNAIDTATTLVAASAEAVTQLDGIATLADALLDALDGRPWPSADTTPATHATRLLERAVTWWALHRGDDQGAVDDARDALYAAVGDYVVSDTAPATPAPGREGDRG